METTVMESPLISEQHVVRAGDFDEMRSKLDFLNGLKLDAVVPAARMSVNDEGRLTYTGENGDREFALSNTFVSQMAGKLGIPKKYLEKCRAEIPVLFADNANAWLAKLDKDYLVRAYRINGQAEARALLSPSYKLMDNIDVLAGIVSALHKLGHDSTTFEKSDLTDDAMFLRIKIDAIRLDVDHILRHYADRFTAAHTGYGTDALQRYVSPSIIIRNSEIGGAALSARPAVDIRVCRNKLMASVDAFRRVHLGSRMEEGDIEWSRETRQKNVELVISQFTDAVTKYLNADWLQAQVNQWGDLVETPVQNIEKCAKNVTMACGFSEGQRDAIFNEFVNVGDTSRFGLVQAITYVAQHQTSGADQYAMEDAAASIIPEIGKYDVPELIIKN